MPFLSAPTRFESKRTSPTMLGEVWTACPSYPRPPCLLAEHQRLHPVPTAQSLGSPCTSPRGPPCATSDGQPVGPSWGLPACADTVHTESDTTTGTAVPQAPAIAHGLPVHTVNSTVTITATTISMPPQYMATGYVAGQPLTASQFYSHEVRNLLHT